MNMNKLNKKTMTDQTPSGGSPETSHRLEGIGEYYFSKKLREIDEINRQGKDIINLGLGSPDLPPHPDVIRV
jgi:LL-diaminopimelate aminotransferase